MDPRWPMGILRFSFKILFWSFNILLQHIFYIFTWREVISYITFLFKKKEVLKMPSGWLNSYSSFYFSFSSIWTLYDGFSFHFLCGFIWWRNRTNYFLLSESFRIKQKQKFEGVKLFILVGPLFFQCLLPLCILENSYCT